MKIFKLLAMLGLLAFFGCGGVVLLEVPEEPPQSETNQDQLTNLFVFEEVGDDFTVPMLIDLALLPSGNWILSARGGHVFLLDKDFNTISNDFIPTNTFLDNGLMGFVLDDDFQNSKLIYFYITAPETDAPCDVVYCNRVVEYKVDESSTIFLTEGRPVITIPMLNRVGQHNGGGMVMGPDGNLYVSIGDGTPVDNYNPAQDMASLLGKTLKLDPATGNYEIVSMGLRNPFTKVSIPGGYIIGDVGLVSYEEANLYYFSDGLMNYGWPIQEGPGDQFTNPIFGFPHCDATFEDEDPFGHDLVEEPKALTVNKLHNGIEHPCGDEIISVVGFYEANPLDPYGGMLDDTVIYSDPYYGFVRGITLGEDGSTSNDRHLAHLPGVVSAQTGPDGYIYAVSIFGSNHVVKLVKTD